MYSGIDPTHVDSAVRPQDDLFSHVNGRWLATAEIPGDRGRYGAFDMLREAAEDSVRTLIVDAAQAQPAPTSPEGKVGALYAGFMDTDTITGRGSAPLVPDLQRIAGVGSAAQVAGTSAYLQRHGVDGLVHAWVTADA